MTNNSKFSENFKYSFFNLFRLNRTLHTPTASQMTGGVKLALGLKYGTTGANEQVDLAKETKGLIP
jgi:hypothetical protein